MMTGVNARAMESSGNRGGRPVWCWVGGIIVAVAFVLLPKLRGSVVAAVNLIRDGGKFLVRESAELWRPNSGEHLLPAAVQEMLAMSRELGLKECAFSGKLMEFTGAEYDLLYRSSELPASGPDKERIERVRSAEARAKAEGRDFWLWMHAAAAMYPVRVNPAAGHAILLASDTPADGETVLKKGQHVQVVARR